jgi:hypothetical protein
MGDSEATLSLVMKARNLASREVDRLHGSLNRVHGAAGRLGGALRTLTKVGVLALAAGALAVIAALGGATKAAAAEAVGIARLQTALKANVKGYKGNSVAIEKLIEKREALGFADDAQRDSLTFLVTKYKSVEKAQKVQAVAMDVARLKGISLTNATALVSRAMDGNAKALKQLGIVLPKTATEQDRLTAVQKKAAGQAEAYGKTAAGAQEAFGIALGDVIEDIGQGFMPVMTAAFTWLRTDALPAIRSVIGAISKWAAENRPLIDQIRNTLVKVIGWVADKVQMVVKWIGRVVGAITSNKDAMNVLATIWDAIGKAIGVAVDFIGRVIDVIARVVDKITSNKDVMAAFATAWKVVGDAVGTVVGWVQTLVGWIEQALGLLGNLLGLGGGPDDSHGTVTVMKAYAQGGWAGLRGPELAMLGERGPEYVVPNHQLGNMAGGAPVTVKLVVDGRTLAQVVDKHLYYRLATAPATTRAL